MLARARRLGRRQLHLLRARAALADAADRSAGADHAAVQPHAAAHAVGASGRTCSKSDIDLLASYVDFDHPTLVERQARCSPTRACRCRCRPRTRTSRRRSGMHTTRYIDRSEQRRASGRRRARCRSSRRGQRASSSSATPRFTGLPFIQTLEPKLFYVYIPYRDQSRLPELRERACRTSASRRCSPRTSSAATTASTTRTRSRSA